MHELASADGRPTRVVIDADAVHLTDTDGADILIQTARELQAQGAAVALAQAHPPTLALWRRAGLADVVADDRVFDTVRAAVDALAVTPSRGTAGGSSATR